MTDNITNDSTKVSMRSGPSFFTNKISNWFGQIGSIVTQNEVIDQTTKIVGFLTILGGLMFGVGVIRLVADNWATMSDSMKTILLMSSMIAMYGLGFYMYRYSSNPKTAIGVIFAACLIYGANIGLIGQIYNIGGNYHTGILLWLLGTIPIAYALRSTPFVILMFLLFDMFLTGWIVESQWFAGGSKYFLYTLIGIVFLQLADAHQSDEDKSMHKGYLVHGVLGLLLGFIKIFIGTKLFAWNMETNILVGGFLIVGCYQLYRIYIGSKSSLIDKALVIYTFTALFVVVLETVLQLGGFWLVWGYGTYILLILIILWLHLYTDAEDYSNPKLWIKLTSGAIFITMLTRFGKYVVTGDIHGMDDPGLVGFINFGYALMGIFHPVSLGVISLRGLNAARYQSSRKQVYLPSLRRVSLVVLYITLILMSFWFNMNLVNISSQGYVIIYTLIIIAFVMRVGLLYSERGQDDVYINHGAYLLHCLFLAGAVILPSMYPDSVAIKTAVAIYIMIMILYYIYLSFADRDTRYLNFHLIVLVVYIISQYFYVFWSKMSGAIFFMSTGVFLMIVGFAIERLRSYLLQHLPNTTNTQNTNQNI